MTQKAYLYSDINQVSPTVDPMLYDEPSINQNLLALIETRRYQRLFNNDFGLDIEDELFELIDDVTSLEILRVITERVERFEPRVTINYAQTEVVPFTDENKYEIVLVFSILGKEEEPERELRGVVSK